MKEKHQKRCNANLKLKCEDQKVNLLKDLDILQALNPNFYCHSEKNVYETFFGFQVGNYPYIEFWESPHLSPLDNFFQKQVFVLTSGKTEMLISQTEKSRMTFNPTIKFKMKEIIARSSSFNYVLIYVYQSTFQMMSAEITKLI